MNILVNFYEEPNLYRLIKSKEILSKAIKIRDRIKSYNTSSIFYDSVWAEKRLNSINMVIERLQKYYGNILIILIGKI